MTGPWHAVGKVVRAARLRHRMTRRELVRLIRMRLTLDISTWHAALMVREIENDGVVLNEDLLLRILDVLDIDRSDVAHLLTQARAASAAAFAADMKRAATVIAKDQGRSEVEIQAGLEHLAEIIHRRPMA